MNTETTDAVIVGAGPVGLLLARRLKQLGCRFEIIEQRATASNESRSIGIHPPGARMLEALGLGDVLHREARRVTTGIAHGSTRPLGTLKFREGMLTLSQAHTMRLLDLPEVQRGVQFVSAHQDENASTVTVLVEALDGSQRSIQTSWLIGCDGHHSEVRKQAGIPFHGGDYPDRFIMGDFPDTPDQGDSAHIFVHRDGLVEGLPIDNGIRRWVVRHPAHAQAPLDLPDLVQLVNARTGITLAPETCTMQRNFTAQHYLADTMVQGRILLAGDAAHVMSPIGGQGMNVGWMDAWEIGNVVSGHLEFTAARYNHQCRKRALRAIRTAARNLSIGRPSRVSRLRSLVIVAALHSPFTRYMDPLFTLQHVPFFSSGLSTR